VKAFFDQLRKEEGATLPIGAAGFCWGGKHTFLLANTEDNATADGKPLIDAGFAGHPSRLKIPGDIEPVSVPISIAVGDKDNQISVPQAEQIRKILEAKPPATKGEIRVYEGAGHGFCIRGELKENKELARQANEAEDQCMAWFNAKFNIS
jgi:dienelactone hydrolase